MKIRRIKSLAISGCVLLMACGKKGNLQELQAGGLTVQVAPVHSKEGVGGYRFRLNCSAELAGRLNDATRADLLFRMDSCFYKKTGSVKYYPDAVQYVPSGSGKGFEYLVLFGGSSGKAVDEQLIYEDRFINKHVFDFKP